VELLLDEHISTRIAEDLRRRGHDVIALAEVSELRGQPDGAVFAWAAERGRSVVTYDTGFVSVLNQRIAAEESVTDVIVVSARRSPPGDRGHGALVRALAAFLGAADASPQRGRLLWLEAAPRSRGQASFHLVAQVLR